MVHDAVKSSRLVSKIILLDTLKEEPRLKEIVRLAKSKGITVEHTSVKNLDLLTENGAHQGIAAYMTLPENVTLESILKAKRNAFILLLSPIDYEQNLGAILRSAWAAGVDAIVISPSGIHEITPVVAKISMGGAAYVPVIAQSLFQAITMLKKYAVKIIGVEVDLGADYTKANLTGASAFVFGNEAAGLTEPIISVCDAFIHIPMAQAVASLNVSVATALVCFEKTRQDRQ